jgi:hypothetical protein
LERKRPVLAASTKGKGMRKESFLFSVLTIAVISIIVFFYASFQTRTKAVAIAKSSIPSKNYKTEKTGSNSNTVYPKVSGSDKPTKAASSGLEQEKESREQLVVFDAWPTTSNNDANKPGLLPLQDANSGLHSENGDQNSPKLMTPQSVLEDEFKNTSELYKGLTSRLDQQNLSAFEYNKNIRKLQFEYDDKIRTIFKTKQGLDATQKLINEGFISAEDGKIAMWRLVLPDETLRAMFPNLKTPKDDRPIPPKAQGMVTGILYSDVKPLAIIDGDVHSEGVSIRGVRVVKIRQDSVEFEKEGISWSQGVNGSPSANWP